jgi:L-threonylcarbamoyladenylate synthase
MTIRSTSVALAAEILQREELVAIPTETVYGLAGNAFSPKAVARIYELKKRPEQHPLILHTDRLEKVSDWVTYFPKPAQKLAERFWPGPLTLVLPKKDIVPDYITGGKDTVAIRVPNHPLTLELLSQLDFPLVAPSANLFMSVSPTQPSHVLRYFESELPMVLDGGTCSEGLESTIIGFDGDMPVVYRLGSLSVEDIEHCVGEVKFPEANDARVITPGMHPRHYAPQTPLLLTSNPESILNGMIASNLVLLRFKERLENCYHHQIVLSERGSLKEAASKLYETLHQLDAFQFSLIIAERFPNHGLGKTMNDRLERASKSIFDCTSKNIFAE